MQTAWRIVKAAHAARAFDGEGARLAGGRWNSPGIPMVYTSATASLAVLEMLVHLAAADALSGYVLIACRFKEAWIERLDRRALPAAWRSYPAPHDLQRIGDEWIRGARSAVLDVPSAIVEGESNFLLNPEHKDFAAIAIDAPVAITFDERLRK